MKFELEKYHRGVSNEELIADLLKVSEILNKETVSLRQYSKHGKYDCSTFIRRFGGWNKTLEKAGLNICKVNKATPQKLFDNLMEVWLKLGRQPRNRELRKPLSEYSRTAYTNHFGTWRKALEAFIEHVNKDESEGNKTEEIVTQKIVTQTPPKLRVPGVRLRHAIMKRDKFKCVLCGRSPATNPKVELQLDHIIPWSKGGETVIENLQTLCAECNNGKGDG